MPTTSVCTSSLFSSFSYCVVAKRETGRFIVRSRKCQSQVRSTRVFVQLLAFHALVNKTYTSVPKNISGPFMVLKSFLLKFFCHRKSKFVDKYIKKFRFTMTKKNVIHPHNDKIYFSITVDQYFRIIEGEKIPFIFTKNIYENISTAFFRPGLLNKTLDSPFF